MSTSYRSVSIMGGQRYNEAKEYPFFRISNLNGTGTNGVYSTKLQKEIIPLYAYKYIKLTQQDSNIIFVAIDNNDEVTKYNEYGDTLVETIQQAQHEKTLSDNNIDVMASADRSVLERRAGEKWSHKYSCVAYQEKNRFLVKQMGKYGIVNMDDTVVIPLVYNSLIVVDKKNYITAKKNNNWGLIDNKNLQLMPFQYQSIAIIKQTDLFLVRNNKNKYGITNSDGKSMLPIAYDSIVFPNSIFSYALIKKGNRWGVVNNRFNTVIPIRYKTINFVDNYQLDQTLFVCQNTKNYWGVVDNHNNTDIPFEYNFPLDLTNYHLRVFVENRPGGDNVFFKDKPNKQLLNVLRIQTEQLQSPITRRYVALLHIYQHDEIDYYVNLEGEIYYEP